MARLRRLYALARRLAALLQRERKTKLPLPLSRRWMAWRRGFVSESVFNYGLKPETAGDYLSDFARFVKTPDINQRFNAALDNKLLFARVFAGLRTPRLLYWLDGGLAFSLMGGGQLSIGEVVQCCRSEGRVVVKPTVGGGGDGVYIVEVSGERVLLNQRETGAAELEAFLRGRSDCLVGEFIEQAAYARQIYAGSTNTIRMLTMWDYDAGQPFLAAAVHRFGRVSTGPVDNWSQGGLSVAIDLDSGRLGRGKMHPATGDLAWHASHPDSGQPIEGVAIPGWEDVCAALLEAAAGVPFIPYVGWDVVVTDGGMAVLEGNSYSGLNMIQAHGPLLRDPRVRRFFQRHGIVGP